MDLVYRERICGAAGTMTTLLQQAIGSSNMPLLWKDSARAAVSEALELATILDENIASGVDFYFGQVDSHQHWLFDSNLQPVARWPAHNITDIPDAIIGNIDGGFCPAENTPPGVANVQVVDDYTVLAFWDDSLDRRFGANSTFVFSGALSFEEALARAQTIFPTIFTRYLFPITLQT